MRRKIFRITLWTLTIPVILIGGLYAWVEANQDNIQQRFLDAVNQQLKAEVQVDGIEVDIFGQFPDISLRLDDVLILDPKQPSEAQDTLLYFESVFAHFELWPALRGQTNLNKVTAHGGLAQLHWDEHGRGNFDILRSDSTATSAHVDIRGLTIKDSEIRLSAAGDSPWNMKFLAQRVRLRGQLDSSSFNAQADWDLQVPQWNDQTLNLHGQMDLHREGNRIAIPKGQFKIQQWTLNLTGEIADDQGRWHMEASGLDLAKIRPWLPQDLIPEDLVIQGNLDGQADVITQPSGNHIEATARIQGGRLKIKAPWIDAGIRSGDIAFSSGNRSDLSRAEITLSNLDIQGRQTTAQGDITLKNFVKPRLSIRAQTDGEVIDLFHWLRYDTWEGTSGQLSSSIQLTKTFDSADQLFSEGPWPAHWKGQAEVTQAHVEVKGAGRPTDIEYAKLELDGQDIIVQDAQLTTGETDFRVSGTIGDALADKALMRHDLRVTGKSWRVEDILDWEIWEADLTGKPDDGGDWRDHYQVDLAVNQLSYDGIVVNNVTAQLEGIGLNVHAKPLSMSHADGMISGQAFYMPLPNDHSALSFEGFLSHINLNTLMNAWDNFGQNQLTSDQISGDLNAQLNVQIEWDSEWNVKEEAFVANADFTMADGRIQGYAPLMDLARFADVEDLKDVRFAPLQNQIRIADRVVNIPQMNLENNALELKVEGSHSFDNVMDFTLRLKLRDIIGRGGRTPGNEELRSLIEEHSDRGPVWIPMHLYGPVDDLNFSLDTKTIREDIRTEIREDWQSQGSEIRDAFRNPQQTEEIVDPEDKYEFEWDDSDSTNLQSFPPFIQ